MKWLPALLVAGQLAGIGVICFSAPPYCTWVPLLIVQALSLVLLIWTWLHLRPGKFHILPVPMKSGTLVVSGPFRLIRHPMYLCLFLYLIPLVIEHFSYWRIIVLLVWMGVMIFKLFFEEKKMQERFPEYEAYMKRSKRMLPFIF